MERKIKLQMKKGKKGGQKLNWQLLEKGRAEIVHSLFTLSSSRWEEGMVSALSKHRRIYLKT